MREEWKLFTSWFILVIILLLSDCTNAPNGAINIPYKQPIRYELIEPLGTNIRIENNHLLINHTTVLYTRLQRLYGNEKELKE